MQAHPRPLLQRHPRREAQLKDEDCAGTSDLVAGIEASQQIADAP